MPITSETVTLAGSGLVFRNTYGPDVTDAYRASILTAENYLQSHFSNAITINAVFGTESLGAENAAATNHFFVVQLGYSALKDALTSHATTSDDLTAVFGLPLTDPSNGAFFDVPVAEARVLGFNVSPAPFDVKVLLSSDETWSYGQDVVGPLLHEITEGGFGRVGSLGLTGSPDWAPMDLFRFTAAGVRDFTGGRDGVPTFFGLDSSHVSALAFHNAIDATGAFDHQDLADWDATFDDAFGPGGPGFPTSVSATDLQVLDVLGWTPNTLGQVANPHDDFASGFSDTSHPMGQIAMGGMATGDLEVAGDRDWFQVTLGPGDYLIGESGHSGGGGSLVDPFLRVYDSTGTLVRQADDIIPGQDLDSRLIMHVSTSETFYIEAGSGQDQGAGTYTVALAQGAGDTTSGSDLMLGQIGGSTIDAGAGDDSIMGRDSPNFLRGNDGDDVIFGGAAFDDINGNKGQDTAHGGEGGDWVVGGQGNDMLFGDDGDDIVYGNLGNDTCDGGSGNDLIRGGQGDDVLTGGDGNDWLSGDRGSDTLTGGAGADTFHTFSGAGIDIVTDFNAGEGDRVQVDAGTNYTVSQQGADVVIDMQNGDELVLKNVTLSTLPATWIFTL